MSKINDAIPSVEPIPQGVNRPFWSVMIPAYNCANYLVETLNSVLAQDPGAEDMQIEVIDDYSTKDDPQAVVRKIGQGRVTYYRHPENRGAISTFNTCIQRAKGKWVHILHGDDLVVPGFYSRLRQSIEQQPTIGAAFCRSIYIDDNGKRQSLSSLQSQTADILSNWVERIGVQQQIETPGIVVRRSVYEHLGGFHLELFHAADWEMWKRIAVHYPVWYEPQPLAYYRIHAGSHTSQLIRTGANVANIRLAIEVSQAYLPSDICSEISAKARENYAFAALNIAKKMLAIGDFEAAIAQSWECLQCSNSSQVIESLASLINFVDAEHYLEKLTEYVDRNGGNYIGKAGLASLSILLKETPVKLVKKSPVIIVDAVFFQLYKTGIARVWESLLTTWVERGFSQKIIVLSRAATAPTIPGIEYRNIPAYDYDNTDADKQMLQQICDEEGADLFISSYYTTPITTPSVFMAYDMIPEVMGWDMNNPMWREKHQAIQQASAYVTISEHTAHDLVRCFPGIPNEAVTVAHCGVSATFLPAKSEAMNSFKTKYGISKPYFLLVGTGSGYKNSILFFRAFAKLTSSYGFDIVCTGVGTALTPEFRACTSGSVVHTLQLSDEELALAYSGAVALVYPSKYEGFGMPVVEAMACGCPVITCPNASIPEAAGEAAIYINDDDIDGLANALCEVQKPAIRQSLITAGLAQAQKFSWAKMADIVSSALINVTLLSINLREINLIIFPDCSASEESISLELAQVIRTLATHTDSYKTTLLVDTTGISGEDAELFLSSVTMNLLMEEDLDLTDGLEISLVRNLADIQWQALLPRLHGRIVLENENQQALIQAKADTLALYPLTSFSQEQDKEFFLLK
jgi:glycosyltransferase involved in cell wall biosynthesis